jgi:tetratricopeptide (TPR) repeat protein
VALPRSRFRYLVAPAVLAAVALAAILWFVDFSSSGGDKRADAHASLAAGIAAFDRREYEDAIRSLRAVPSGSPEEAVAKYYEGSAQLMLKDFEAATEALEAALALNDQDIGTLYALGVAWFKRGNLQLAKAYFKSVLQMPSDHPKAAEIKDQARGLVDIIASLERQQPAADTVEQTD